MSDKHDEVTDKLLSKLVEEATRSDIVDFLEAGIADLLAQAWVEFVSVDPGPGMSYLTDRDYDAARDAAYGLLNKLLKENS